MAVLSGSVVLGFGLAAPASAATAVTVSSVGGIAADGPLNRVFVSDNTAGTVKEADSNGALIASRSGFPGVAGLAVSTDGKTLYAAVPDADEVVTFDAATLRTEATYPIPTTKGPVSIAFAAGKAWFSYGDQWDSTLGSIDGNGVLALDQLPTGHLWNPVVLNANPGVPGMLVGYEVGMTPSEVYMLDVSTGTPQLVSADSLFTGPVEVVQDAQLLPGSPGQVLLNGAYRYDYSATGLTSVGSYPNGSWSNAASVSPDGLVAQVRNGGDVSVFRPGMTQPLRTYTTNAYAVDVALAPDDSRVYALETASASSGTATLKVLTQPTLNVPVLTVKAPTSAPRAKKLTVTGKLTGTVAIPSGTKLKITRTDLDSPSGKVISTSVAVGAGGAFSFSDTPPAGGNVWYRVAYAGDAQHTPVAVAVKVAVARTTPKLTLNNSGKTYNYGQKVTFTAHLGSEYKNRTVSVYNDFYGADWGKKLLKTAKVNSAGNVSVSVTMDRDTVVSAVYAGDDRTASKTVSVKAYAHAKVSLAVSKYYRTGWIGSVDYYWVHKKTDPVLTTTMNAVKGRYERLDIQVYANGQWYDGDSEYFPLSSSGKVAVTLEAPGQAGVRARVRAVYVRSSSGDIVNTTTYGAWKYLYFTS